MRTFWSAYLVESSIDVNPHEQAQLVCKIVQDFTILLD